MHVRQTRYVSAMAAAPEPALLSPLSPPPLVVAPASKPADAPAPVHAPVQTLAGGSGSGESHPEQHPAPPPPPPPPKPVSLLRFYPDATRQPTPDDEAVERYWLGWGGKQGGVAFWNWAHNQGTAKQCEGYALGFDVKAKFRRDPFVTCRYAFGASLFAVEFEEPFEMGIPPEEADRIKTAWNRFIPDESPRPVNPARDTVTDAWVASLGPGGSVRLLKRRGEPHPHVWYLLVSAGLDRASEEMLFAAMAEWQPGGEPDLGSPADATPAPSGAGVTTYVEAARLLERVPLLTEEIRARIACTAARHARLRFVDGAPSGKRVHETVACDYASSAVPSMGEDAERELCARASHALAWTGVPAQREEPLIPTWYRLPSRAVASFPAQLPLPDDLVDFGLGKALERPAVQQACGIKPLTVAFTVKALVSTTWNVLVETPPGKNVPAELATVFFSECTPFWDETRPIITFDDPVFPVRVFNWPTAPPNTGVSAFADYHAVRGATLGGFPNVVPRLAQAPTRDLKTLQDPRRRFTAATERMELQKHFTNDPERPAATHTMVMGTWRSSDGSASWDEWRFPRAEALFDTHLARFAVRAYDGRAHVASVKEVEHACDAEHLTYRAPL